MRSHFFLQGRMKSGRLLVVASTLLLAACGGGSSSSTQTSGPIAGNWQFALSSPSDGSFTGTPSPSCPTAPGTPAPLCSGGFLVQNKGAVSGAVAYSISAPGSGGNPPTLCGGSAPVTGTIDGQNVTLTFAAAAQTLSLTGTLSSDGSTMNGTYASTDGKACGPAQSGLKWTAISVPPLNGDVQGIFHSANGSDISLKDQDFAVTGTISQGGNIGASSAAITGTLAFQNYPCMSSASLNGQISGSSVVLQIIGTNGLNVGQIGAPLGSAFPSPVVFQSATGGPVMSGTNGYRVTTKPCSSNNGAVPGDAGNICLALGTATTCTQPILLTPASVTFPPQVVGTSAPVQQVTLTNIDPAGSTLKGLSISFNPQAGSSSPFNGFSDFDGLPNYACRTTCIQATEQDCPASGTPAPFSLAPHQSCSITITFTPQQSCPWLPETSLGGIPPAQCPLPLTAKLGINSPKSVANDTDNTFGVPITGTGLSAIVASTPELDFGSEALSESSAAQQVSFTNQGGLPVQILPALSQPCQNPAKGHLTLPRPLVPGSVDGVRVVTGDIIPRSDLNSIDYICDVDVTSGKPNFQISSDTCSGRVLAPLEGCSVDVAFAPQPGTPATPPPDYFVELDTLQCTSTVTSNCEIDSGRFPVELKANAPSPLRMSPGAGLDFGIEPVGQVSNPLTITLFNDPKDPNKQTVNFTGNLVKGDYTETDDCGIDLAPGGSCTMTVTFTPQVTGPDPGTITITYTVGQTQFVFLRGTGQ